MWMGAAPGGGYLVEPGGGCCCRPAPLVLLLLVNPFGSENGCRARGNRRAIWIRTSSRGPPPRGWQIVKAHPWFELVGAGKPNAQLMSYIPADEPALPAGAYIHLHNVTLRGGARSAGTGFSCGS